MVIVTIVSAVFQVPGDFPCTCFLLIASCKKSSVTLTRDCVSHNCVTIIDKSNPREKGVILAYSLRRVISSTRVEKHGG